MKFAKLLQEFAKTEDEEKDEPLSFIDYKKLKKLLKAAADAQKQSIGHTNEGDGQVDDDARSEHPAGAALSEPRTASIPISEEEKMFIQLLQQDLEKINARFMEKEEMAVITLQHLIDKKSSYHSLSRKEAEALRAAFVDFHGEMVLLLHWSLINYAGVVKILKKHDKLLGGQASSLQRAGLKNLLKQPFTSTESISRLVKEAETHVKSLSEHEAKITLDKTTSDEAVTLIEKERSTEDEAALLKRTRAAIDMLSRLQDSAHTPSTLLPLDKLDTHHPEKRAKQ